MLTYDDLVKLALRYADEARKNPDRASNSWRMAIHYQTQAARLDGGKLPDIGKTPPPVRISQRSRRRRKG